MRRKMIELQPHINCKLNKSRYLRLDISFVRCTAREQKTYEIQSIHCTPHFIVYVNDWGEKNRLQERTLGYDDIILLNSTIVFPKEFLGNFYGASRPGGLFRFYRGNSSAIDGCHPGFCHRHVRIVLIIDKEEK